MISMWPEDIEISRNGYYKNYFAHQFIEGHLKPLSVVRERELL